MVMSHINLGSSLVFPSCSIEYQLTVPMLVPQSVYMLMFLVIKKKNTFLENSGVLFKLYSTNKHQQVYKKILTPF